jgi:surface-anchored protein
MNKTTTLLVAAACCAAASTAAQTTLTSGHLDLGVAFEEGAFHLHIHDEENEQEFSPDEAILQVGQESFSLVPSDARYSFLGAGGSPVFILPQVENPSLIFLGVGAEEIEAGLFQQDQITLTLRAIAGPGSFAGYSVDGFGNPAIHFNSRDGLDANDRIAVTAGGHSDINWAFSAPGSYRLTFEASGSLAGGGMLASGPVDFHFAVVPEPSTWALLGMGALALAMFAKRKF